MYVATQQKGFLSRVPNRGSGGRALLNCTGVGHRALSDLHVVDNLG